MILGALRPPTCAWVPMLVARPSVNPMTGLWHVAQLTVPSEDSRASKKSWRPSSTFAGVIGLSSGTGGGASMPKGRSNVIGSLLNSVVWGSAGWQAEMTGSRIVRTKIDLFTRPSSTLVFWPPGSAVLHTDPFPGRPAVTFKKTGRKVPRIWLAFYYLVVEGTHCPESILEHRGLGRREERPSHGTSGCWSEGWKKRPVSLWKWP